MAGRNYWNSSVQAVGRNNTVLQLLNARIRVILCDNRTFVGTFSAYDKHMNMVLTDCTEYKKCKAKRKPAVKGKKTIEAAIIRGENIKSVMVESQPEDTPDDSSWKYKDALSSFLPLSQDTPDDSSREYEDALPSFLRRSQRLTQDDKYLKMHGLSDMERSYDLQPISLLHQEYVLGFPVVEPLPACGAKFQTSTPYSSLEDKECMLFSSLLSPIPNRPEGRREIDRFDENIRVMELDKQGIEGAISRLKEAYERDKMLLREKEADPDGTQNFRETLKLTNQMFSTSVEIWLLKGKYLRIEKELQALKNLQGDSRNILNLGQSDGFNHTYTLNTYSDVVNQYDHQEDIDFSLVNAMELTQILSGNDYLVSSGSVDIILSGSKGWSESEDSLPATCHFLPTDDVKAHCLSFCSFGQNCLCLSNNLLQNSFAAHKKSVSRQAFPRNGKIIEGPEESDQMSQIKLKEVEAKESDQMSQIKVKEIKAKESDQMSQIKLKEIEAKESSKMNYEKCNASSEKKLKQKLKKSISKQQYFPKRLRFSTRSSYQQAIVQEYGERLRTEVLKGKTSHSLKKLFLVEFKFSNFNCFSPTVKRY